MSEKILVVFDHVLHITCFTFFFLIDQMTHTAVQF